MNAREAIWMAMECAATELAPISPIRNTAALKMDTSKTSVAAIGSPSFHSPKKRGQSARQKRPNRW
jgi:hypothetical protein